MNKQQNFYTYDTINLKWKFPSEVVLLINEAMVKYGEDNVEFTCEIDYSGYDDTAAVYLECKRPMTPEEIAKIQNKENELKQKEYQKYLELKKIYET